MSEIKITQNSLENAILKDGNFVSGYINQSGTIDASGNGAHAEGYTEESGCINATGNGTYAEGYARHDGYINATGNGVCAEGYSVEGYIDASGNGVHAEGYAVRGYINATGNGAHAEGYTDDGGINATGNGAHAEGYTVNGGYIDATGNGAHAEGINTQALGSGAHAEGYQTTASGTASHAGGIGTIASQEAMTAIGKYNNTSTDAYFVVGNGSSNTSRKDAFVVDTAGNVSISGNITKVNNVSINGNVSIGSIAMAKVNNVDNVYLGCPIGTVVMWAGVIDPLRLRYPPDGWLLCDGSSLDIEGEYNNLYSIIGTQYGGNGSTFNLPNLQQKFPIGAEIGGVGNITNKGTLKLNYSGNNRYYEGNLEIGQFLDLDSARDLPRNTEKYTRYCVIVSFAVKFIGVYACNEFGKITDKTIKNLYEYFEYNTSTPGSITLNNISILQNDYLTILGSTGGEETHNLELGEMYGAPVGAFVKNGVYTDTLTYKLDDAPVTHPHNNIPPYLAINFIIKYK